VSKILEVEDISKAFGGLKALNSNSFSVEKGSITGLIGPNGSGKTTMFNVITGYEKPDSGTVVFKGEKITGSAPDKVCRLGIGRTFQLVRVFNRLNLIENIQVGSRIMNKEERAERYSTEKINELLDFVGLQKLAREKAGNLSYGQRKLIELATIIAQEPEVILLDEPAGGINPTLIQMMADRIREINKHGVTFLVVEHNMDFVMGICDEITVMERGAAIATGVPATIRGNQLVLDAYLGGSMDDDYGRPVKEMGTK
jgi:ABC-type branched-subunit amino acid transport system ATPase component